MFSESRLPEDLIQAYRQTHYKALGPACVTLIINEQNPALSLLHLHHRVDCSAFLTAANPLSAELTPQENSERQLALADELRLRGLAFVEGIGQHPSNGWGGEPSFLVFGLNLQAAKTLAIKHEQNALVWSGSDSVPKLILLR